MSKNKILDPGCGNKKRDGTIGVDFNERTKAYIIHDLNKFPYPFESQSIVKIANKWPLKYERYLSHFIPLDEISFFYVVYKFLRFEEE